MPKVSVILPAYNSAKFIGEAINSILSQSFVDFELLIIDDSSTDNTLAVAKQWEAQDSRVKVLINNKQKGVAGALNTGLAVASGEYVARMDSDDISLPHRLATQVAYLDRHKEVMIVGCYYEAFNAAGFSKVVKPPTRSLELAWSFIANTQLCHPSVMFRAKVYTEFGGYPYEPAEDYALFSLVLRKYQARNIPQVLLRFRLHDSNVTITNKGGINSSQREISLRNYKYYFGSSENYELFIDFLEGRTIRFRHFLSVLKLNLRLIQKLLQSYRVGARSAFPLALVISMRFLSNVLQKLRLIARVN